jgi:secondary thiamine-phosphate synthase enzyme
MAMIRHEIRTRTRNEFVDVTNLVRRAVHDANPPISAVLVSSPHTTAGITVQENADPDVVHDLLLWLNDRIPKQEKGFRHGEGNSDSHLKTMLVGTSVTVPIENGELVLGTWQGIYFCEFDGPRTRTVHITLLS